MQDPPSSDQQLRLDRVQLPIRCRQRIPVPGVDRPLVQLARQCNPLVHYSPSVRSRDPMRPAVPPPPKLLTVMGFADYQPEESRRELSTAISVREALPDDRAACARLIVTRTGGDVEDRRSRLQA